MDGNNANLVAAHTKDLSVLLQTLWLRRTAVISMFFGQKLTDVEPGTHLVVECGLPKKFKDTLDGETRRIRKQLTEEQQAAWAK